MRIAAKAEVQRLLDAGVIRPVKYPKWLSNVVLIKKKNDKWRMCVDFTGLNKACPKDNFSYQESTPSSMQQQAASSSHSLTISRATTRSRRISKMRKKTSFITPFRTYCFRRMVEGLRNAGSTFARMTAEVFKDNKTISAYVDNIVVQSS